MRSLTFLALAGALAGCGDTSIVDPMERQPKARPFSANDFFEDGRGMRTPPSGAVPRERITQNPQLARGKDANGADVTVIPLPVTRPLLELGRKRFDIVCAACHGLLGDGDSPVAQNMSLRPPPNLHQHREETVGHYFQVITSGYGLMPSYAAELTAHERWAVIAYLRALQASQDARLTQAPAPERERLLREKPR